MVTRRLWELVFVVLFSVIVSKATDELGEDATPPEPRDPTLVTVAEGTLRGVKEEAVNGKEFYSFRGIPFAKPPVGDLRFQPAEPAEPWDEVRASLEESPRCPQIKTCTIMAGSQMTVEGSEDCLYLNVFSSMPDVSTGEKALPVMVFIHGGGYFFGHAGQYPPYTLLSQDIVLVVIQYRLGTLGFLSTEDDVLPGNMGILDQTLALKWIQKNVDKFGGNPLSITLFGESAGAASSHIQMLSHTSLGYFHRVIIQSGTALSSWAMNENHKAAAYYIGQILECHSHAELTNPLCKKWENMTEAHNACLVRHMSSEQLLACLKDAPLEKLAEAPAWFFQFHTFPLMMAPRVNKNLLMQDPVTLIKEGRSKKLDVMIGVTRDEGAVSSLPIFSNEGLRSAMRFNFEATVPVSLDFGPEDIAPLNQTINILDFYVGNNDFDGESADEVTAMYGDRLMWYPVDVVANSYASDYAMKKKKKNVYQYQFAYRGEHSFVNAYNVTMGQSWVTHADDLIYLFGAFKDECFEGEVAASGPDRDVSNYMVKLWTNFAATGNPTPDEEELQWTPYTEDSPNIMIISENPLMESAEKKNKVREFWQHLPLKINLELFPDKVGNLTKIEVPEKETETQDAESQTGVTPNEEESAAAESEVKTPTVSDDSEKDIPGDSEIKPEDPDDAQIKTEVPEESSSENADTEAKTVKVEL